MKNTKFYFAIIFSLFIIASSFANASNLGEALVFAKLYESKNVAVNVFLTKGSKSKKTDPKFFIEIENKHSEKINYKGAREIFLTVAEEDFLNLRAYLYDKEGNVITNVPKVKRVGQSVSVKMKTISIAEGQKKLFELPLDQNNFLGIEEKSPYRVYIKFRKFASWKIGDGQWGRIGVSDISFESVLID